VPNQGNKHTALSGAVLCGTLEIKEYVLQGQALQVIVVYLWGNLDIQNFYG